MAEHRKRKAYYRKGNRFKAYEQMANGSATPYEVLYALNNPVVREAIADNVAAQLKWERDAAIAQLESYGVGFCEEKKDLVEVVRCKDCTLRGEMGCPQCRYVWEDEGDDEELYIYDDTTNYGFCYLGVRRKDENL